MASTVLFTVCLVVGLGLFAKQMHGRLGLLLASRPDGTRWGDLVERVKAVLVIAFGQFKFIRPQVAIVRETFSGWAHFITFWGFTLLGAQVVTMFGRAYIADFYPPLLSPDLLGKPYALVRDFFEVGVFLCVCWFMSRWLFVHPRRLIGFAPAEERHRHQPHWEAVFILACIGMITLGGLVYDGGRIVAAGEALSPADVVWEPFSFAMSKVLAGLGPSGALGASNAAWWVHNLAVLTMLNFLPLAKHFHIITSLPNVFFRKLEPLGALSKMDLENATTFGTSHIDQFTWKQVLDMFTCTECGRCSSQCPATATGKPLAPRQMLLNLRDYLYSKQDEMYRKHVVATSNGVPTDQQEAVGTNILPEVVEDEVVWSCNTCRACEEACPVMIEYVDKIVDMRRHLVQEEARFPTELNRVFKSMENQSNPWGIGAEKRFDWAEGMDVPTVAEKPDAEYLYYVGCAGAFDDRNRKTTQAFVRLLKKAGIDFACLGPEEPCNGDSARRLGNEYLYQAMAQACVETLNGYGVKKVLTNCPHCFNTIKNELPQFGGTYQVIHAAEFVQQLIADGKLSVAPEFGKRTVYHDSCYYGRFNDVYDEPRDVLAQSGADVVEMDRHKHFGMCCGAGGGRMWLEEDPDKRVNLLRTAQALDKNPEAIAVSCPFCMTMISDGIKAKDLEDKVQTLDVMEIVERSTK